MKYVVIAAIQVDRIEIGVIAGEYKWIASKSESFAVVIQVNGKVLRKNRKK